MKPLVKLVALKDLNLAGNKIADLSPLAGITALKSLVLDDNQVTDLAPLIAMFSQPAPANRPWSLYRSLSIKGNPLSADAVAKQLPELGKYAFDVIADNAPH